MDKYSSVIIDKIFDLDDKLRRWIENNKGRWYLVLIGLGISLGGIGNYFLGGNFRQGFLMVSLYSFTLVIAELTMGGKGIE